MNGLHLMVNPLYLLLWNLVFMADLDNDTPTTPRESSFCTISCKYVYMSIFFIPFRIVLLSFAIFPVLVICFCFWNFLSLLWQSNFHVCKTLKEFLFWFWFYLSNGFFLFSQPKDGLFHLQWEHLWLPVVDLQQQLPNENATTEINSRPFTCFMMK